jgi:CRISPR type III-B/RAMP module-associated protein Cmr3
MFEYYASPYDVLFFRGNKSFYFGEWRPEGVFPPYPSTFQGFVRSKLLDDHEMLDERGKLKADRRGEALKLVGSDSASEVEIVGPFLMQSDSLQRNPFFPAPLDLQKEDKEGREHVFDSVFFEVHEQSILHSDLGFELAMPDAISNDKFEKTCPPQWLSSEELSCYRLHLKGVSISEKHLLSTEDRAGIGLGSDRGAIEGRFYVTPFNRLNANVGFYFACSKELKPTAHKIGSENHPVCLEKLDANNQHGLEDIFAQSRSDLIETICETGTFRLVLLQPGVFEFGWMPFPYEIKDKRIIAKVPGSDITLRLLFTCLDRPLIISGYSFEANREKMRQKELSLKQQVKAVPAGSVYFFKIEGETTKSTVCHLVEQLDNKKVVKGDYSQIGFNHAILACGPKMKSNQS